MPSRLIDISLRGIRNTVSQSNCVSLVNLVNDQRNALNSFDLGNDKQSCPNNKHSPDFITRAPNRWTINRLRSSYIIARKYLSIVKQVYTIPLDSYNNPILSQNHFTRAILGSFRSRIPNNEYGCQGCRIFFFSLPQRSNLWSGDESRKTSGL